MIIKELIERADLHANKHTSRAYEQFKKLLHELRKRELPDNIVLSINEDIDECNVLSLSDKALKNLIHKKMNRLIQLLEKELKLVCKNHYRSTWLALGMTVFGIPFGVLFGAMTGNMAFLGIGLPIGMAIGIGLGTGLDKKAADEGRQLDVEIEF